MRSASRFSSVHTIDERLPLQRQDRERSRRQEMLLGAAMMIALMRHRGDDAGLIVIPADAADAGRARGSPSARRRRRPAARADSRRRRPSCTSMRSALVSKSVTASARSSTPSGFGALDQRVDQRRILDHVRERLARLRPRRRTSETSAASRRSSLESVTDHVEDRLRARPRPCPRRRCVSNSRRAAAAIAEARGRRRRGLAERRIGDRDREADRRAPGAARSRAPGRRNRRRRSAHRCVGRRIGSLLCFSLCFSICAHCAHVYHRDRSVAHVLRRPRSARHPRPRTARGEPVPRP